jgi:hypothetical protein
MRRKIEALIKEYEGKLESLDTAPRNLLENVIHDLKELLNSL